MKTCSRGALGADDVSSWQSIDRVAGIDPPAYRSAQIWGEPQLNTRSLGLFVVVFVVVCV